MANPDRSVLQPDVYEDWDEDPQDLGSVTAAPGTLALRTETGALAVGPATADDHAVPKSVVDTLTVQFSEATQDLASASPSVVNDALVRRNAAGQFSVPTPTAPAHVAPRSYVDEKFTGNTTVERLRVTSTGDASAASTLHGIQVGPDNGVNLAIDNDEILFRNNGVQTDSVPVRSYVDGRFAGSSALVTMAAGWTQWGGAFAQMQVTKIGDNFVMLQGMIKNNNAYADGTFTMFTVPSDYRPAKQILTTIFGTFNLGNNARMDVFPSGVASVAMVGGVNAGTWHSVNLVYPIGTL